MSEWIAIGAAAAAALALLLALGCYVTLRRVRQAQLVLLGGGKSDLVDFAVSLQGRVDELHRSVDEIAAGLDRIDRRVDDTVSKTAIVRYDACDNSGGHPGPGPRGNPCAGDSNRATRLLNHSP